MKLGKKAKDLLAALAPTVATAFGSPIAGMAVKHLIDKLGVEPGKLNATLAAGDPGTILKVKEVETAFELKMREMDIDLEEIAAGDRQDARQLGVHAGLTPQISLAVVFVSGYFGIVFGLLLGWLALPAADASLLAGLIGVLTAGVIKVMDFFFGSSAGSKMKTAMSGLK